MAVTGVTNQEYINFLENGGQITFVIDSEDISNDSSFENFEPIKPYLYSGFEIRPSTIIHDPEVAAQLLVYGDSWTKVTTFVYRNGGKIIYRKRKDTGKFQADCSIPT